MGSNVSQSFLSSPIPHYTTNETYIMAIRDDHQDTESYQLQNNNNVSNITTLIGELIVQKTLYLQNGLQAYRRI